MTGDLETMAAQAIDPELLRLRESIDNFDAALIYLLAERFRCTQRVGELKARKEIGRASCRERVSLSV